MAAVANRRSIMTLYSDPMDHYCHRVRIVMAEKEINVDILDVRPGDYPEDLKTLNPYTTVPTLVDRDLVIYPTWIILEYLDERFPHPPLMPVYPVARAECRRMMYRLDRDVFPFVDQIERGTEEEAVQARVQLQEVLTSLAPAFGEKTFFLHDEFTLVDCCLAPLMWRLDMYGIKLKGNAAKMVDAYRARIFERPSFKQSLSEAEQEIMEDVAA
jgi:RNA polymerase-associated protein